MEDIPIDVDALASSRELEEAKKVVAGIARKQVPPPSSEDPEYLRRHKLVTALFQNATADHVNFLLHEERFVVFASLRRYLRPDNNPMLPIQDVGCYVQNGVERLPTHLKKQVTDFVFAREDQKERNALEAMWKDIPIDRTYTEILDRRDCLKRRYNEELENLEKE